MVNKSGIVTFSPIESTLYRSMLEGLEDKTTEYWDYISELDLRASPNLELFRDDLIDKLNHFTNACTREQNLVEAFTPFSQVSVPKL